MAQTTKTLVIGHSAFDTLIGSVLGEGINSTNVDAFIKKKNQEEEKKAKEEKKVKPEVWSNGGQGNIGVKMKKISKGFKVDIGKILEIVGKSIIASTGVGGVTVIASTILNVVNDAIKGEGGKLYYTVSDLKQFLTKLQYIPTVCETGLVHLFIRFGSREQHRTTDINAIVAQYQAESKSHEVECEYLIISESNTDAAAKFNAQQAQSTFNIRVVNTSTKYSQCFVRVLNPGGDENITQTIKVQGKNWTKDSITMDNTLEEGLTLTCDRNVVKFKARLAKKGYPALISVYCSTTECVKIIDHPLQKDGHWIAFTKVPRK